MGIVAVSMVFTSCKDDEEEPEQQTEHLHSRSLWKE